jgi:uncharacterized membrane protein
MADEDKAKEESDVETVSTTETEAATPEPEVSEAPAENEEGSKQESANPPEPAEEPEIDDMTTLHERTIAALSYFGFMAIVPFYLKKDSKFCRYHGKQGLTFAIIFHLFKLIAVLDLIMDMILILQAVIALWLGFAALAGRWKRAPVIYKYACQLEDALSLKTKEEEEAAAMLKPEQVKAEDDSEPEPAPTKAKKK